MRILKEKISLFCNVRPEAVITAVDVNSIYEVPLKFNEEGLDGILVDLEKSSTKTTSQSEEMCSNLAHFFTGKKLF